MMKNIFFSVALCIWLTACGSGTGNTSMTHRLTPAEMLAQVRAAGQTGAELDVQPLRDPQVEDLRASATQSEMRGDYRGAAVTLGRALVIMPNDPDLLQWQAELSLVNKDWQQADQYATRSFEKGPKLGGLCRRSWTTRRFARQAMGDAASAAAAQQRIGQCAVTPPVRM
jgi:Flp pilus assembly protein TadD